MNAIEEVFEMGNFEKLVIDGCPATWFRDGEPFSLQEWPEGSELRIAMEDVEDYIDENLDSVFLVITITKKVIDE